MEFDQIEDTPPRKRWLSDCGNYRIDYFNSFPHMNNLRDKKGKFIGYKPAYYASVRYNYGDRDIWSFAHKHGRFTSFNAAEKACRTNRRKWKRLLKAKSAAEVRELVEASVVGMGKKKDGRPMRTHQTTKILTTPPAWVDEVIPRRLRRLLPGAGRPKVRKKVVA
jgi:hypothetical protein